MEFEDFWKRWPDKKNRFSATKAFAKLKPDEQQKAIDQAASWSRQWRKDNPQASHIHASTYLNQKRFLDIDETPKHNPEEAMKMCAAWITDGKDFMARSLKPNQVAHLIRVGLVTEEQCRRVGVL